MTVLFMSSVIGCSQTVLIILIQHFILIAKWTDAIELIDYFVISYFKHIIATYIGFNFAECCFYQSGFIKTNFVWYFAPSICSNNP